MILDRSLSMSADRLANASAVHAHALRRAFFTAIPGKKIPDHHIPAENSPVHAVLGNPLTLKL